MELAEAIELIRFRPSENKKQAWMDLGCGDGLFTSAVASFLPKGSIIHAVDKDEKALRRIPGDINGVMIEKSVADFLTENVFFLRLDGVLMANSLHFIPDRLSFLRTIFGSLKEGGLLVLVEYDLKTANPWVPYPVTIDEAGMLLTAAGFGSFEVLCKKPSVYGNHSMYAMLVKK